MLTKTLDFVVSKVDYLDDRGPVLELLECIRMSSETTYQKYITDPILAKFLEGTHTSSPVIALLKAFYKTTGSKRP